MSSRTVHHTTQAHPAYEPRNENIRRGWLLVIVGLIVTALGSLSLHPVCRPDASGANESGFGVRHEQRGTGWYHCEPWIRSVTVE